MLAAKAATVQSYLEGLKPKSQQPRPLDPVKPPSAGAEAAYTRQLGLAECPGRALGLLQEGRLMPGDLKTLQTLYPKLLDRMKSHVGVGLIDQEAKEKRISYRMRMKASLLFGQPLDSTMTQSALMACIQGNGDAETTTQGPEMNARSRGESGMRAPSSATQRTISKTDRLYETPLESVEVGRKT